ncbi:aminopeptidase P family protein [Portibacter marinus]|uniref:aminopeptidase P family protein n=1 Tax=Portibacter marinus TaxID=2898660 RepID=UPI001F273B39|nr:aminopeptidase P family protein [Portibacter marinus]
MSISKRVSSLRNLLKEHHIQAYIIPSSDPHQGEYVASHWEARAWVSGFTGSAGTAVVTEHLAGVWTDSRYFIQGERQLKNGPFELHKVYNQGSPQYIDWLLEHLEEGDLVACDGRLFSKKLITSYQKKLAVKNIELKTSFDLISDIWEGRPPLPGDPIFEHKIEFAGESRTSKIKRIRGEMKKAGATHHLISTLDDIAWTFNIRGRDVQFNPVAYAYALITLHKATLYVKKGKVDPLLEDLFIQENIDIQPYHQIWKDLNLMQSESVILIDENTISYSLYQSINTQYKINNTLPTIKFKAIKNEVEIQHFRNVMVKDGVALVKFYGWLEEHAGKGITEYDLVQKLAEYRGQQKGYFSESFNAIVGFKGNGAIVHYRPSEKEALEIRGEGMLLVDSGGQYLDGTTDITRTTYFGVPTDQERDAYTRVLKGNIELDRAVFPEGTLGVQLDTLARLHLWRNKMDFLHGTGHGIGSFLNVHEGPQGFYPGIASRSRVAIDEFMVTTNEPGYYEEDQFGIRIENCLLTVKAGKGFLKFETLTLFPIETDLILMPMLSREEVQWLNEYHSRVYERLSPHLNLKEKEWLKSKCAHI